MTRRRGYLRWLWTAAVAWAAVTLLVLPSRSANRDFRGGDTSLESYRTYEALKSTRIDESRMGKVDDVTFHRDAAVFHLKWGVVHFFEPHVIDGTERVTGAIFVGAGVFTFSPPLQMERDHLEIFADSETLQCDFDVLYLRFSDDTFDELSSRVEWTGKSFGRPEYHQEHCEKFLDDELAYRLLQSAWLDVPPGYFYAHVAPSADLKKPYFVTVDPTAVEEVALQQRAQADTDYRKELVNQFDLAGQHKRGVDSAYESKQLVVPHHYVVETTFEKSGKAKIKASVDLVAIRGPVNALAASLSTELRVQSVVATDERPVSYYQEGDQAWCRIFLEEPLADGDSLGLILEYEGRLMDKNWAGLYFSDPIGWYPRFGDEGHATFDLTFSVPKPYQVVSGGECIEQQEGDKRVVSRYRLTEPQTQASFNIGEYKVHSLHPDETVPPVTVYLDQGSREARMRLFKRYYGSKVAKDPEVTVARDISDAAKLFCWYFGKCAFDSLAATHVLEPHGLSFPGLLHLSFGGEHSKYKEAFHGHEVAHQWWGLRVAPRTYHDKWLAEGLAEYFGYRYAAWSQKDDDVLYELVGLARERLIENRKTALRDRRPIAPLWFGFRANSSETAGDYWLLVYEKGAVVLHMLRSMLLDLGTDDESAFIDLMRDFFARYDGRYASTRDFQSVVEDHVGIEMDWFFDQWVYGTEIPTYEFGYGHRKVEDGKVAVRCRVTQKNVSPGFRMYATVKVEFEGDQFARFRVLIDEPTTDFALPLLPMEPKNVVFNDLHSVLAEVEF